VARPVIVELAPPAIAVFLAIAALVSRGIVARPVIVEQVRLAIAVHLVIAASPVAQATVVFQAIAA